MKDPFNTRVTKNDKKVKKGLYTQKYIRLKQETLNYMKKIGFEEKISIGEHYDDEQIVQKDLLFLKIGDK